MKKGDLIYLPSNVNLVKITRIGTRSHIGDLLKLQKPKNVLFLGDTGEKPAGWSSSKYLKVLYDGEEWLVKEDDAILGRLKND